MVSNISRQIDIQKAIHRVSFVLDCTEYAVDNRQASLGSKDKIISIHLSTFPKALSMNKIEGINGKKEKMVSITLYEG